MTVIFPMAPGCSCRTVWHQGACHHLRLRWDRCQGAEHCSGEVWGQHFWTPRWNWLGQLQWVTPGVFDWELDCLCAMRLACRHCITLWHCFHLVVFLPLILQLSKCDCLTPRCHQHQHTHQLLSLSPLVTLRVYDIDVTIMLRVWSHYRIIRTTQVKAVVKHECTVGGHFGHVTPRLCTP